MSRPREVVFREHDEVRQEVNEVLEQNGTDKDAVFGALLSNMAEMAKLVERDAELARESMGQDRSDRT